VAAGVLGPAATSLVPGAEAAGSKGDAGGNAGLEAARLLVGVFPESFATVAAGGESGGAVTVAEGAAEGSVKAA
jgi:hypothetical protein